MAAKKLDLKKIYALPPAKCAEVMLGISNVLTWMKKSLIDGTPLRRDVAELKSSIETMYGEIIDWEYQMMIIEANRKRDLEDMNKKFSIPNGPTLEAWYAKINIIGPSPTTIGYRDRFTHEYSWAVPSKEVIDEIAAFMGEDRLLEVGAGRGLWAHLLRLTIGHGRVIATDRDVGVPQPGYVEEEEPKEEKEWFEEFTNPNQETFTHVRRCSGEYAVGEFKQCNVLLSIWPYMHPWIGDALGDFMGNKFIYVGEERGGCTGSDNLFDELEINWNLVKTLQNPVWFGIHDAVYLYTRK